MPRSAVELTTNFNTGESNRDLAAGLKWRPTKQLVESMIFNMFMYP